MVNNQSGAGESGVYLLRTNAKSPDVVVITVRSCITSAPKVHHIQLQRTGEGTYRTAGHTFKTLHDALAHYAAPHTADPDTGPITRRIQPL
jgi:hypothetical protein